MKVRTTVKAGGIATDPDSLNVIMAIEFARSNRTVRGR
jgi:hypothetical protein